MPTPIHITNVVRVKLSCWLAGQLGLIVKHYYAGSDTGTGVTQLEAAVALSPVWAAVLKPLLTTDAQYLGLSVKNLSIGPPLPLAAVDDTGNGPGTAGGPYLPTQVCGLVTLRSDESGRANRGRSYIPFPSETDHSPPQGPTAAYLVRLDAFALQSLTAVNVVGTGGSVNLVPFIKHSKTLAGNIITATLSREVWATQRRRGQLGRPNPREIAL